MRFRIFRKNPWIRFLKDEQGISSVEYAVAGGFVAAVVAASYTTLGNAVVGQINRVISALG